MAVNLHRFSILILALAAIAANACYAEQSQKTVRQRPIQTSERLNTYNCGFKCIDEAHQLGYLQDVPTVVFKSLEPTAPLQYDHGEVNAAYEICSSIEAQIDNDLQLKQTAIESLDCTIKTYSMVNAALSQSAGLHSADGAAASIQQLDLQAVSTSASDAVQPALGVESISGSSGQVVQRASATQHACSTDSVVAYAKNSDSKLQDNDVVLLKREDSSKLQDNGVVLHGAASGDAPHELVSRPASLKQQEQTEQHTSNSMTTRAVEMPMLETSIAAVVDGPLHCIAQLDARDLQNISAQMPSKSALSEDQMSSASSSLISWPSQTASTELDNYAQSIASRANFVQHTPSSADGSALHQVLAQSCIASSATGSSREANTARNLEDITEEQTIFAEHIDWFSTLSQMYLRLQQLRAAGKSTSKMMRSIDHYIVRQHDKSEMLLTNSYVVAWSLKSKTASKSGQSGSIVGFSNALLEAKRLLSSTISEESGIDFSGFRSKTILSELEGKMKSDMDVAYNYYVYSKDLHCLIEIRRY